MSPARSHPARPESCATTTLSAALHLGPGSLLGIVGGGGKTSLMYAIARELAAHGQRVICTTTTKIFPPSTDQRDTLLLAQTLEGLEEQLAACATDQRRIVLARRHLDNGKLDGVPVDWPAQMLHRGWADAVLVEADGAARKPFKAPAEHEPVMPAGVTVVAAVVGLDIVHRELTAEHVFRPELVAKLCDQPLGSRITVASVAAVMVHPQGLRKHVPPGCAFVPVINKVDSQEQLRLAHALGLAIFNTVDGCVTNILLTRLNNGAGVVDIVRTGAG